MDEEVQQNVLRRGYDVSPGIGHAAGLDQNDGGQLQRKAARSGGTATWYCGATGAPFSRAPILRADREGLSPSFWSLS